VNRIPGLKSGDVLVKRTRFGLVAMDRADAAIKSGKKKDTKVTAWWPGQDNRNLRSTRARSKQKTGGRGLTKQMRVAAGGKRSQEFSPKSRHSDSKGAGNEKITRGNQKRRNLSPVLWRFPVG